MRQLKGLVFFIALASLTAYCNRITIQTAKELVELFQNATEPVLEEDIDLVADLDFENITLRYSISDTKDIMYSGKFNGNGHAIKNLNITNEQNASLFTSCRDITVTDLVLDSSCSFTGNSAAGLCIDLFGYGTFKNVINKASVASKGSDAAGFIASAAGLDGTPILFDNCINEGPIQGIAFLGGFIGDLQNIYKFTIEITECANHGTITCIDPSGSDIGGFIGHIWNSGNVSLKITNAFNSGSINTGGNIGGFLGNFYRCTNCSILVTNSTNNGTVQGEGWIGGLVGIVSSTQETDIVFTNTRNHGKISGSKDVGGFFGRVETGMISNTSFEITECINSGEINGNSSVGGFFGDVFNSGLRFNITNSVNSGMVNGQEAIGGFFGLIMCQEDMVMSVTNSHNNGTIAGFGNAGGFIGSLIAITQVVFRDCSNTGTLEVSCTECTVGGLIGMILTQGSASNSSLVISSLISDSLVNVSCENCTVGGVIGFIGETDQTHVSIADSVITGSLIVSTNFKESSTVGGIIGYTTLGNNNLTISISNCSRKSIISATGVGTIGGFIGFSSNMKTIINCTIITIHNSQALGSIMASDTATVGGLIGDLMNVQSVTITHSQNRGLITLNDSPDGVIAGGFIGSYTSSMNIILTPRLSVTNCNNYGDIVSNDGNSVLGGIVGLVHSTVNIHFSLENLENFGPVRALNNAGSVGGLVGSIERSIAFNVLVQNCTNHGETTSGKSTSSDPNGVGGLVGNVADNGNMTMIIRSFKNHGPIVSSSANNLVGGLVGRFVGNGMSSLSVYDCLNNNTVNASGETNDLGGLVGCMCENPLVNVKIIGSTNNGDVYTLDGAVFSNVGGIVGNMTQSPSMNIVIDNVTNNGNVASCLLCDGNAGGIVGRVAPIYKRSTFTLSVSNSVNNGNVTSSTETSMACGLFCFPSSWNDLKGSIILTNVINKGHIGNETAYGIATKATYANNVVSLGPVTGDDKTPFFCNQVKNSSLFVHKHVCPNCKSATVFEEDRGFFVTTKDKKRVDEELNKKAVIEQYGMVWSNKLDLEKGIVVVVGKPIDQTLTLVQNTGMGLFQALVNKFIEPGLFHFVNRKNMSYELDNHTLFKSDTDVALCHKVLLSKEYESTVFVEYNTPLGLSVPSQFFNGLYTVRNTHDSKIIYNASSTIESDTEITITAICSNMDPTACSTTKTCMWFIKCFERSIIIPVIVVCSIAVFACIAAAVFVLVCRIIKKHKKSNGYSLMEEDLFKTKGGLTTVTVPIHGESKELQLTDEVGHGSFATVWKVLAVDDQSVFAVKILNNRNKDEFASAQKEADLLCQLDTQFVVAVYGCSCTDKSMAIAMEYFPLGSLQKVLQDETLEADAHLPMLLDTARAMEYLHSIAIIHRDLKPGNVLVCSLDPRERPMCKFVTFYSILFVMLFQRVFGILFHRLSDFGEARAMESIEESMTMTSGVGTPFYMAPEMIKSSKHYTGAVDVYSFGIMAAQVMVGKLVYDAFDFDTQFCL